MDLVLRIPKEHELQHLYSIEAASYPEDEAATLEKLRYRLKNAPELFYAIYLGSDTRAVGFIVSTRAHGATLEHDSMSQHEPSGDSVCIHSVVVDEKHRHKGVASRALSEYLQRISSVGAARSLLLCKSNLIHFYERCGFVLVGASGVVHGAEQWFEMRREFR